MLSPIRPGFGRVVRWMIATAAVILCILICELGIRVLGYAPHYKVLQIDGENTVYRRSDNPVLGFELKAAYRDDAADMSSSYPSTNRWGQRDIERELAKPAGVRRVIVLGDSVVEGHDLADLDQTLTRQLEQYYPDGSTEVFNFGVSGYCTLAEVELLRVKGLRFDPDVVILVFVENDYDDFNREAHLLGPAGRRPQWVHALFQGSHLFRMAAVRFNLYGYGAEHDPVSWNRQAIGDNNVVQGFRMLADLAQTEQFLAMVAIMPMFDNHHVRDVHFMDDGKDRLVVEELAAEFGIRSFRLSEDFEASPGLPGPRLRFTVGDGLHLSAEGHRVAAAGLHRRLESPPPAPAGERLKADRPAIAAADALGEDDPGYGRIHNNRGLHFKDQGRIAEAEQAFRQAVAEEPDLADAWNNLANLLQSDGRLEEAVEYYRTALKLQPGNAAVLYNLGLMLEKLDRPHEALAAAVQAVECQPGNVPARMLAGRLCLGAGDFTAAEQQFEAVVRLEPDHGSAWANLGNLMARRGDYVDATRAFRESIRCDPQRPGPYRSLIRLLATAPAPSREANSELLLLTEDLVAVAGSEDAASLELLAMARAAAGKDDAAVEAARRALDAAITEGDEPARERLSAFLSDRRGFKVVRD